MRKKKLDTRSLWAVLLLVSVFAWGCNGGPERTITPAEEKKWRTPPKEPPPEYRGNQMGSPGTPPPGGGAPGGGSTGH